MLGNIRTQRSTAIETLDDWVGIENITGYSIDELREKLRSVSETGLGPGEVSILEAIWHEYGQVESEQLLARYSFGIYLESNRDRAFAAIDKCFTQGWIQFITNHFCDQMRCELIDGGYLILTGLFGPNYLVDPLGLISFTKRGAALYQRWIDYYSPIDEVHCSLIVNSNGFHTIYGTTVQACRNVISGEFEYLIEEESPIRIGRWCDRWWNRFEQGFQIRFRASCRWEDGHF